ncbi:uncharacterized protein G2W53_027763 [Senna tora]|uniref:Uncharacterized protein n=1 Tax=Senna tora TaxID=362788 RepID=A0A834THQ0_9FABA|nr:uncharacterized protein G2W53_027763 [Senna tora]
MAMETGASIGGGFGGAMPGYVFLLNEIC